MPQKYNGSAYLTLAARANALQHACDIGFRDLYAEQLMDRLPVDLSVFANDSYLVRSVILRARLIDRLVSNFIKLHPGTVVANLGCGLCCRAMRIRDNAPECNSSIWFNIDLPEVIAIRKQYRDIFDDEKTVECSIDNSSWLDEIPAGINQPFLLVMEGVAPYLEQAQLEKLCRMIGEKRCLCTAHTVLILDFIHLLLTGAQPFPALSDAEKIYFRSGFLSAKDFQKFHSSIKIVAEHHFLEDISLYHAAFNREFLEKTGGAFPYTVAELSFYYEKNVNTMQRISYSLSTEKCDSFAAGNFLKWNPCYLTVKLSPIRMLFISETVPFLLEGEIYRSLFELINGKRSLEEIVLSVAHTEQQANLHYVINQLIERGFIIKNDKSEYAIPDFNREPIEYTTKNGHLRILSQYSNPELFIQWFEKLKFHSSLSIVVTDDYLDPRLDRIHRLHVHQKKNWILLKPTGKLQLIGPLFGNGDNKDPCLVCLTSRLLRNQPVRKWLQEKKIQSSTAVPILYKEDSIKKALFKAGEKIGCMLHNRNTTNIWALSHVDDNVQKHKISKRPQCIFCGDQGIAKRQSTYLVELTSGNNITNSDGGYRVKNPKETIEQIMPLISPITGVINELSIMPGIDNSSVPIYRSSFFRSPINNQNPQHKDFFQISLGKGISDEQSRASALSESIERYATHYDGDEYIFEKPIDQLNASVIFPNDLVFSSQTQAENAFGNQIINDVKKWTVCWSLTKNKMYYIPFTYCYYNSPFELSTACKFNSNGCAAGNTIEEAILQGFFEIVERDAVAIWWYNRVELPQVNLNVIDTNMRKKINDTLENEWDYWVLHLLHDFKIPVMIAIGRHKKKGTFRLGFGCHINVTIACCRALTELCQIIAIKDNGTKIFNFDNISPDPFLFPSGTAENSNITLNHNNIVDCIQWCVTQAEEMGKEVFVHKYPRPDLPLKVVKVIIPGLCHIWPQFGNKRLYSVPVAMGWRDNELNESQLNPLPLLL